MKINNLAPDELNRYVKVELFNPAGSVNDRLAITIIEETEKRGDLKPGQTLVEATIGRNGTWPGYGLCSYGLLSCQHYGR